MTHARKLLLLLVALFPLATCFGDEPAVMARWHLDGDLRDATGKGHDATAAQPQFVAGHLGQAFAPNWNPFEVADHPDLRLSPGLTVDCWVCFPKRPVGYEQIVMKDKEYQIRVDAPSEGGRFSFFVYLDGWEPRVQGPVPEAGKWYHIIAQWDGAETSLTVNGQTATTPRTGAVATTKNPIHIGSMSGYLDEVAISNPNEARARELRAMMATATLANRVSARHLSGSDAWVGTSGASVARHDAGVAATLNGKIAAIVHPALDVDLNRMQFLSLDIDAPGANLVAASFITDQGEGSVVIPVAPAGRISFADLSACAEWSGHLKLLAISFPQKQASRVILRNVWFSTQPEGRPFLYLRSFAPGRAILRAGREETVIGIVRNLGKPATGTQARLTAPPGVTILDDPMHQIGAMRFDATEQIKWRVRADRPGDACFEVALSADGFGPARQALSCRFTPALNLPAASYVPEPHPAKPSLLTLMHYCPLWKEGTHYGWEKIEPWPERRPAIGYYDEGTPEVADWHIKMALEHGIQGFIYCWYRDGLDPQIKQSLGHAIHDGLLKARYVDRFKFAIMWENGCGSGIRDREDLLNNLMPFWIKNYFSHPSYVKIDNKPLLYVWVPSKLSSELGGSEATRDVLDQMRAQCRKAGFDGLYIVGCVGGVDRGGLEQMGKEGWDASSAYGCIGDSGSPTGRDAEGILTYDSRKSVLGEEAIWRGKRAVGALPDITDVMMGWDPRPWAGKSTQSYFAGASADAFKLACQRAKALIDATPGNGLDKRVIVFDNWCEFGEGHYLEPTSGSGFAYLDAIKQVFCPGASPCQDITPEDVGLKPPERAYMMRRELLGGFPDRERRVVDHLIGWWSFDDDDPVIARDKSACAFHAFKQGFESAEGKVGKGFLCNGGSVAFATHPVLFPQDGITLDLWMKTDVAGQSDRWMLNTVGAANTGYRLGLSDGKVTFQLPKTAWSHSLQAPAPIELGKWTHVIATYDDQTMRLFIDGTQVASLERGGPINPSSAGLCIGNYGPGNDRAYFQGVLDEVRILDRALTAEEVATR